MDELADSSVQLVVTSPPYWQLKEYGSQPGQIGFGQSYEEYVNSLNLVWSECVRVLHPGCRLCVNIGDQFARSAHYGRYKVIPIRTEIIRFCESAGLDYMGAIIWRKVTSTHTTGGGTVMGSFPYPRNGILRLNYEFILLFKKPGKAPAISRERKEAAKLSNSEWSEYFSGQWKIPGERSRNHLAAFPEELPRRLIRMFTFGGETVLDPFAGSGTTALAAARLDRSSVGYEINERCLESLVRRMANCDSPPVLALARPEREPVDPEGLLDDLPYRFKDPVGLTAKTGPRRKNYGSRVNERSRPRENYFRIAKVKSPVELELDNGEAVRLIGLRPLKGKTAQAVQYLRQLTAGRKVYLREDPEQAANGDTRPVYLYLANRTFVNLRLIRQGLARADRKGKYEKKKKFLAVEN
ncbi:MAG: site-specific DNA-methyltransferase [Candidatus Glassbacteria bacterium]|nr:site-specific DNA-methyltransferase [Candidatus Glassbacteria bacterium]